MSYADKLIPIQSAQSTSSYKSKLIPIQSERDTRIAQGQAVSTNRRFERTGEATPNFGGEIVRSVVKPIARLGQNLTGKMGDNGKIDSRQSNYLGTINPVGNSGDFGKDVLDSIGVGAEIGSNLVGGTGAGAVVKTGVKGAIKQGAVTGLKSGIGAGATYGLGAGLQDQKDKNVGQILGNTAMQAVKGGTIGGLAGGVLGGAVAPVLKPSILLPKSSATKAISKTENELLKIENNYQKLRKNAKFSKDGNQATRSRIANTGILSDATDSTGTIITDKAVRRYRELSRLNEYEDVVRNNLERLGETVDLNTLERKLTQSVYDSGLQGANLESAVNTVKKEIAGYRLRANPDGRIPLTLMHDAKIDVYNSIDFNTPAEIKAYKKTLAKGLKEVVEENSNFNVKEVNSKLAPLLKDIDYLESLNGRKVKGGKLGKYSARIAGNIAGGIAGGSVGGLPGSAIGTIVGGEVGDVIQGKILKNTFGRTAETALPESEILKKAVQTGNSPRLQLPAPKAGQPRVQQVSGKVINLPKRTQSAVDAQSLANLKAQKIAPPSKIPSKVSISKSVAQNESTENQTLAMAKKNFEKRLREISPSQPESWYRAQVESQPFVKNPEKFGFTKPKLLSKPVTKTDPLLQEAKKYKSAEEFVKGQANVSHGGNIVGEIDTTKGSRNYYGKGFYATDRQGVAGKYGSVNDLRLDTSNIVERKAPMSEKFAIKLDNTFDFPEKIYTYADAYDFLTKKLGSEQKASDFFAKNGIDGWSVKSPTGLADNSTSYTIFNKDVVQTKSQLTDIWNKANKGKL